MDDTLDTSWVLRWAELAQHAVSENRIALMELDRAIGDGDHGDNLDRGFTAVSAKLADASPDSPTAALKLIATTLMSTVGGAAGPLYGTAFLRAATALGDGPVDAAGVAALLTGAVEGVTARGRAEAGDKTMVDALRPAAEAARAVAEEGGSARAALAAAADAAAAGAEATEPMVARKGRASYLGERSAGHRDPGAQSSALILRAAADAAAGGAGQ
ncbi:MAG TPA: dihydroxyacetone kinase subunit DhaL [Phototrophicaceae bacterium]|uniref:Dihydroxyacetone kinase subunit L n=1 Tax=Oceanitalea stevensii TaxID=2763072 RepID=A0ABR8YXE3_9MICO|nr:dihydroxyacetone kinase subunit DhaL [Oceanitalea stevensii]MBD8060738.1 dihydroxyacetone kinase subunit L [Oceanitalea stevensii]HLT85391.1 dihydroxyacetone kinase subunit DhaL [Phototrophicaceae bacterium]